MMQKLGTFLMDIHRMIFLRLQCRKNSDFLWNPKIFYIPALQPDLKGTNDVGMLSVAFGLVQYIVVEHF